MVTEVPVLLAPGDLAGRSLNAEKQHDKQIQDSNSEMRHTDSTHWEGTDRRICRWGGTWVMRTLELEGWICHDSPDSCRGLLTSPCSQLKLVSPILNREASMSLLNTKPGYVIPLLQCPIPSPYPGLQSPAQSDCLRPPCPPLLTQSLWSMLALLLSLPLTIKLLLQDLCTCVPWYTWLLLHFFMSLAKCHSIRDAFSSCLV